MNQILCERIKSTCNASKEVICKPNFYSSEMIESPYVNDMYSEMRKFLREGRGENG